MIIIGVSESARLMENAACKGADPRLFDAIHGDEADDALSYCDRCPVVRECEEYVKPRRSYFDGVCAGKVWANGSEVKLALFK